MLRSNGPPAKGIGTTDTPPKDRLKIERAHYTARRKEIWEALHPEPSPDYSLESYDADDETEVAQLEPPQFAGQLGGARPQTKGFAASTAEVTGESKAQINRNVSRAEAIGDAPTRSKGKGTPAVFQSRG